MTFLSCALIALTMVLQGSALASPLTDEKGDSSVVLRFGGDCLLAGHFEKAVRDSVDLPFAGFDLLREADIGMVNLESPITRRGAKIQKPFNFRMHPKYVASLTRAGIDIVNIANNHIFDYGNEGLFDTISYLDSAHVLHVGAGRSREEARRPAVVKVKDQKIGFVGYYGGGEAPVAGENTPGVAARTIQIILDDLRLLRQRDSVNFVVVTLHWGTEKAEFPDEGQRQFAREIIDGGADAVIGHHPHVLQGIERYKSGVIVYSLGNFIFGGLERDSYDTGLFEIKIAKEKTTFTFLPVGIRGWNARALHGPDAARVLDIIRTRSSSFPNSLFTN